VASALIGVLVWTADEEGEVETEEMEDEDNGDGDELEVDRDVGEVEGKGGSLVTDVVTVVVTVSRFEELSDVLSGLGSSSCVNLQRRVSIRLISVWFDTYMSLSKIT